LRGRYWHGNGTVIGSADPFGFNCGGSEKSRFVEVAGLAGPGRNRLGLLCCRRGLLCCRHGFLRLCRRCRLGLLGCGRLGLLGGRRRFFRLYDFGLLDGRRRLFRLVGLGLLDRRRRLRLLDGSGLLDSDLLWRLGGRLHLSRLLRSRRLLRLGRLRLLGLLAEAEAARRSGALRLLQAGVLHSGTQRNFQMGVDDVLVGADLEVFHDVLEDGLARRSASFLQASQRLVHHLAVLGMVGRLFGRLAGCAAGGGLLLRGLCLHVGGRDLCGGCSCCVRHLSFSSTRSNSNTNSNKTIVRLTLQPREKKDLVFISAQHARTSLTTARFGPLKDMACDIEAMVSTTIQPLRRRHQRNSFFFFYEPFHFTKQHYSKRPNCYCH
jgi:hypothetical protein